MIDDCGIYCIENLINGKKYIGQSTQIRERLSTHRTLLNKVRKGENPYLMNAWRKYGEKNFRMFVLELCSEEELNSKEIHYISLYNSLCPTGYNITSGGNKPPSPKGKPKSEQWRINQRKAKLGHPVSMDTRIKISKAGLGRKRSISAIKKNSISMMGRTLSKTKSSIYVGVCLDKRSGKWRATCCKKPLGLFEKEIDAAIAYDDKSYSILKDKSKLNFPNRYGS